MSSCEMGAKEKSWVRGRVRDVKAQEEVMRGSG